MSSQFTTPAIAADQWKFLKEKYAAINVQNKTLDPRTAYAALNRVFYAHFGCNLPEGAIDVSIPFF
jgi:hypothetical protein